MPAHESKDDAAAAADRDFQSPDWSLGNIVSWIAFRDPALIRWFVGCFVRFEKSGSAVIVAPPEKIASDPEPPRRELLAALKAGKVTAIKGGEILPREWWFGLETRHLPSDLRFRRDDAMNRWRTRARHKPGPEPRLRNAMKEAMLADLRSQKRTPEQLQQDTIDVLVAEYGGSRNTASAARKEALSEFARTITLTKP